MTFIVKKATSWVHARRVVLPVLLMVFAASASNCSSPSHRPSPVDAGGSGGFTCPKSSEIDSMTGVQYGDPSVSNAASGVTVCLYVYGARHVAITIMAGSSSEFKSEADAADSSGGAEEVRGIGDEAVAVPGDGLIEVLSARRLIVVSSPLTPIDEVEAIAKSLIPPNG